MQKRPRLGRRQSCGVVNYSFQIPPFGAASIPLSSALARGSASPARMRLGRRTDLLLVRWGRRPVASSGTPLAGQAPVFEKIKPLRFSFTLPKLPCPHLPALRTGRVLYGPDALSGKVHLATVPLGIQILSLIPMTFSVPTAYFGQGALPLCTPQQGRGLLKRRNPLPLHPLPRLIASCRCGLLLETVANRAALRPPPVVKYRTYSSASIYLSKSCD